MYSDRETQMGFLCCRGHLGIMTLEEILANLDPYEFEKLVAALWESKGYDTIVRTESGDRGVDVEAEKGGYKEIIQAKHYDENNNIGSQAVRKYATLYQQIPTANSVVIVTTSGFTNQASKLAEDLKVEIVNRKDLLDQLQEYEVDTDFDLNTKDSFVGAQAERLSFEERKRRAEKLSTNSHGKIPAERIMKAGSGNPAFKYASKGNSPVEKFTLRDEDRGIQPSNPHQPHYILTSHHGLKRYTNTGENSTMWVTDGGIYWASTVSKSITKVKEVWEYLSPEEITTVYVQTGFTQKSFKISHSSGDKYEFNIMTEHNKYDSLQEIVHYVESTYPNL